MKTQIQIKGKGGPHLPVCVALQTALQNVVPVSFNHPTFPFCLIYSHYWLQKSAHKTVSDYNLMHPF